MISAARFLFASGIIFPAAADILRCSHDAVHAERDYNLIRFCGLRLSRGRL